MGRKRTITATKIIKNQNYFLWTYQQRCQSIKSQYIKSKIIESQCECAKAQELVLLSVENFEPSKITIENYLALNAHQSVLNMCKKVILKTTGRWTAENSLIGLMALACLVATTHFIVVRKLDWELCLEVENFTKGNKLMFKLMQSIHNDLLITIIYLKLVFYTDDTIQYIFQSKE